MVASGKERAHGQTGAEEEARERSKEIARPDTGGDEVQPLGLTRAWQRMKLDLNSKDHQIMQDVQSKIDDQIFEDFADAFGIEYEIYDIVRKPRIDTQTGEVMTDDNGLTIWARNSDGSFIEDWSLISAKDREALLYKIVTKMFTWEQQAARIWTEAIFAKAVWEEAFATGFDSSPDDKKTVEARSAYGNRVAAEHRYLAVFKSGYSRQAEAIVRSLDRLCQRLKDLHV